MGTGRSRQSREDMDTPRELGSLLDGGPTILLPATSWEPVAPFRSLRKYLLTPGYASRRNRAFCPLQRMPGCVGTSRETLIHATHFAQPADPVVKTTPARPNPMPLDKPAQPSISLRRADRTPGPTAPAAAVPTPQGCSPHSIATASCPAVARDR